MACEKCGKFTLTGRFCRTCQKKRTKRLIDEAWEKHLEIIMK